MPVRSRVPLQREDEFTSYDITHLVEDLLIVMEWFVRLRRISVTKAILCPCIGLTVA